MQHVCLQYDVCERMRVRSHAFPIQTYVSMASKFRSDFELWKTFACYSSALCQCYCPDSFCSGCPCFVRVLLKVDWKHLAGLWLNRFDVDFEHRSPIIVLFRWTGRKMLDSILTDLMTTLNRSPFMILSGWRPVESWLE